MNSANTALMQPSDRDAFSCEEIAAKLGITTKTWWRFVKLGRAPKADLVLSRRIHRWSRRCLDKYLAERAAQAK